MPNSALVDSRTLEDDDVVTTTLKRWALIGAAAMGLALAGCGGSNDSNNGTASVRVANATLTHASLDLLANSATVSTATATDTIGAYVGVSAGVNTPLQINDTGSGTSLTTTVKTLTGGNHYALVAYESSGAVKTALVSEDYAVPTANTAQLRIYNAAPEAGNIDVYVTAPTADISTGSPISMTSGGAAIAGPSTYAPGTYRVRVTGAGNKSDLRLDIPSVTLTSQQVGMIVLTPTAGGILLNGATLIQQSTYIASRNTNARVRLAGAVSGGATVAALAGSTVIDAGSVAPSFSDYVLVPSTSTLNISVNGNSVGAPATPLSAGSDVTLMVYGSAASPIASLIADDNRVTGDTTSVKMRVINGITGSTGSLRLTANTSLVGGGAVAPGLASAYTTVPIVQNPVTLSLTSSTVGGTLFTNNLTLNPGTSYTVMFGDGATPTTPAFFIR